MKTGSRAELCLNAPVIHIYCCVGCGIAARRGNVKNCSDWACVSANKEMHWTICAKVRQERGIWFLKRGMLKALQEHRSAEKNQRHIWLCTALWLPRINNAWRDHKRLDSWLFERLHGVLGVATLLWLTLCVHPWPDRVCAEPPWPGQAVAGLRSIQDGVTRKCYFSTAPSLQAASA